MRFLVSGLLVGLVVATGACRASPAFAVVPVSGTIGTTDGDKAFTIDEAGTVATDKETVYQFYGNRLLDADNRVILTVRPDGRVDAEDSEGGATLTERGDVVFSGQRHVRITDSGDAEILDGRKHTPLPLHFDNLPPKAHTEAALVAFAVVIRARAKH